MFEYLVYADRRWISRGERSSRDHGQYQVCEISGVKWPGRFVFLRVLWRPRDVQMSGLLVEQPGSP